MKDNIDTADNMVTTAGSLALADNRRRGRVPRRAPARGGRGAARQNEPERVGEFPLDPFDLRLERPRRPARNPYVLDRNPCGSSSGTGAAIAASLATVGVGTETDGSIICPAAVNGLVGLKPTVGLVEPTRHHSDLGVAGHGGSDGRTVADVAAMLAALVAADAADPASAQAKSHAAPDYTAFLNPGALAGKRIGLVRQALGFNADADAGMERAVATMTTAGAIVIDVKVQGYRAIRI